MKEKREHDRKPARGKIRFAILRDDLILNESAPAQEVAAEIVDLSQGGFGLLTTTILEPGQKITLLDKDFGWELPDTGVVVWTTESSEGCRAGVRFI